MILHLTNGSQRDVHVESATMGLCVKAIELNTRDVMRLCELPPDNLHRVILSWMTRFPPEVPTTPKGETIPQTVENLQAIMARDAETMLAMQAEIADLRNRINQAQQLIRKLRSQKRYWLS